MEYDRQEILDKAALAYNHAEATIRAMDDVFQNVTGSDYSAELTLAQFDMILQGVLLSVAMADGVFEDVEQDFIRQFAMHGDLLEYIRNDSNGEVDLTWDAIAGLPGSADMIKIAGLLAFVDSEGTDDEINAAVSMIYELEGKHWRDLLSGRALGPGQEINP